jgi:hypothetical protein
MAQPGARAAPRRLPDVSGEVVPIFRSDEHALSTQTVAHPVDRLAFLEETGPPVVISARPADSPPAGAHPLDELEAVSPCLGERLPPG